MDRDPEISVVIPVLDAERYLERCLQSLLAQGYRGGHEVIVVDNGSEDDSRAIVERHPGIALLSEARRGAYAARNRGIAEARGSIIAFVDPDCVAEPDWLERIAAAMAVPTVGVVLGPRRLPSRPAALPLLEAYESEKEAYVLDGRTESLYYGYTNNMAVRRSLFEELGPFLEVPRGADTIFVRRVVEAHSSDAVRYRPDVIVTHLEVDSVATYYRKVFLYGRHRDPSDGIDYARPLSTRQRLEILRKAVRDRGLSSLEALHLLALLAGGAVAWSAGRWSRFARSSQR